MATKTARSVPYKVTLTPELHERLREVAAQLGQAPATVAAMAIGQWVAQMGNTLGAGQRMVDAMAPQLIEHAKEQYSALTPDGDRVLLAKNQFFNKAGKLATRKQP